MESDFGFESYCKCDDFIEADLNLRSSPQRKQEDTKGPCKINVEEDIISVNSPLTLRRKRKLSIQIEKCRKKLRSKSSKAHKQRVSSPEEGQIAVNSPLTLEKKRIVSVQNEKCKKKPRSKSTISHKQKISSPEDFYGVILSWPILSLLNGGLDQMKLPLTNRINQFTSPSDYFSCMLSACFEECQAALLLSLNQSHQTSNCDSNQTLHIALRIDSETYESNTKNIFCVDCKISTVILNDQRAEHYFPTNSHLNPHTASILEKPGLIFVLSSSETSKNSSRNWSKFCTLLRSWNEEEKETTSKRNDSCDVTICFHSNDAQITSLELLKGTTIFVRTCASLLSYQRMAVATSRKMPSSILQKLTASTKPSTHIKFRDDDDDDVNDSGNRNEPSDSIPVLDDQVRQVLDILTEDIRVHFLSLNCSQQKAISRFIAPVLQPTTADSKASGHLNLIQGPPGCGKTHVLSAILCILAQFKYSALVCAPSNKAVCVALETFLSKLGHMSASAGIVLIGVEDRLESCSSPAVAADSSKQIQSYLSAGTCGILQSFLQPSTVAHVYLSNFNLILHEGLSGILKDIGAFLALNRHCADLTQLTMTSLLSYFTSIKEKLEKRTPSFYAEKCKGFFRSIFLTLDSISSSFLESNESQIDQFELSGIQKEGFSSILKLLKTFLSEVKSANISDEVVATADFVFCTACSSGNRILRNNFSEMDVLIIDEAAQLFEPELLVPLQLCPRNLVMIGDPRQLPATIFSKKVLASGWGMSAMQRLMDHCSYPFDLLQMQYRMHPSISHFSNQHFYGGQIVDSSFVQQRRSLFWKEDLDISSCKSILPDWVTGGFAFIDVDGTENTVSKMGNSMQNLAEAEFIARVVVYVSKCCGIVENTNNSSITVITFYAAQVACIQKQLKKARASASVKVLTVDSFQGSEADVVIVSFVRSNGASRVGFVRDYQRLNVALTRAKHLLLAVGSRKTLENFGFQSASTAGAASRDAAAAAAEAADGAHPLRGLVLDARARGRLFTSSEIMQQIRNV